MKPSLQLRLSQHLALTPQLQQSIRLLQLSTLELQQEVDQMLDQNPFLEADEDNAAGERTAERVASTEPAADAPVDTSSDREDTGFDGGASCSPPSASSRSSAGFSIRMRSISWLSSTVESCSSRIDCCSWGVSVRC